MMRCKDLQKLVAITYITCWSTAEALKLKFRSEECMQYHFDMYQPFYGSYVSLPDMYGFIARYNLEIHSPSGNLVYHADEEREDKFNLIPYETGKYRFCLKVVPDRFLSRYVYTRDVIWDLHESKVQDLHDHSRHGKESDTESMWHYVSLIDSQLQQLKSTQQYLYWRERRHRQTVDSTNSRVWWYALARNAALIAVSVGQVIFIRWMFSK
ncbi:hypothetical protein CEUSTIGMA_g4511.t1 [Chlamydomonas eustigma]|uniref:GOLD domain-containing protein n=1 Tax=Chlamydomonas eustigma TaxID=1157962 RepID=A0A250X1Y5_9CHLO|nr:hypothetical protein CEUSTIGMA_g4511.t1 [Chlamydomonas eustigma]|eukprot:GAX77065.1 hypothetical protein CEUSTIGMA_g4511.t1 [Chlamydomonas eustigma]